MGCGAAKNQSAPPADDKAKGDTKKEPAKETSAPAGQSHHKSQAPAPITSPPPNKHASPARSPVSSPPTKDFTRGKVWPGTYNLGRDEEAIRVVNAEWHKEPGRSAKLRKIIDHEGTVWYEAVSVLGKGAQGGVWKCKNLLENGQVEAVKVFNKAQLEQEQAEKCLHNPAVWHEFQLLKRLKGSEVSSNIVQMSGLMLETDDDWFMPMEFLPGVDLHTRLWPRDGKTDGMPDLDPRYVWRTLINVLKFCHSRAIVHRDLKPNNMMLCPRPGEPPLVKLMDFGLGAEVPANEDGSPQALRRPEGTPSWCAPEVLRLYKRLGKDGGLAGQTAGFDEQDDMGLLYYARPADVWSSGVILWEVMTRNPLFQRHSIGMGGAAEWQLVVKWVSAPQSLDPTFGNQPEIWKQLEPGAQSLIQRILNPTPKLRPKAAEICEDPWLNETTPLSALEPRPLR